MLPLSEACRVLAEALELLADAPSARLEYLNSKGAPIGKEHGTFTCVDDYWRKLIIEEALANAQRILGGGNG